MAGSQQSQCTIAVLCGNNRNHANTHVEGLLHLLAGDVAELSNSLEDRARGPCCAAHVSGQAFRHDANHVASQSATGDVAESANLCLVHESQAVLRINLGWLQQLLTEGTPEVLDVTVELQTGLLQENVASQRVAVGVKSRGLHGDNDIALTHAVRAEKLVLFHDTDAGSGDIILVWFHHTRVLCSLAAQEGATRLDASLGDAGNDLGDVLRHDLANCDVVLQEQRLGAAHNQVIDDHGDQVQANGVVLADGLRHGQLGPHTIGGCGQQRLFVVAQCKQAGKTAEPATDLWASGLLGNRGE